MKFVIIGIIAIVVLFVFYKSSESKKIAAENLVIGQQFLQENQNKEGIQTTPSGLQFEILTKGDGTQNPTASNTVTEWRAHITNALVSRTSNYRLIWKVSVYARWPLSVP